MSSQLLVAGHTLVREGHAFNYAECNDCTAEQFPRRNGHAHCSCGAVSQHLPSTAQRKAWHRDHKQEVAVSRSGDLHACPSGRRTDRAIKVEQLVTVIGRAKSGARRFRIDFDALADHLMHMRMHRLCYICGYPLDNSAPHPNSVPPSTGWGMKTVSKNPDAKSLVGVG